MERSTSRLSQWIYYLAAAFYYIAALLRTLIIFIGEPQLARILLSLLLILLLFLTEPSITRRWSRYFIIYLLLQTVLVFSLLPISDASDFFAAFLNILSMQAMLNLPTRYAGVWIALCAPVMYMLFVGNYGVSDAISLTLIYTAINAFLGSFALNVRREQSAHEKNLQLASQLNSANQQLQEYSTRLENLAVTHERNRFARELHDSVTQTVFSMTLTTQSAILLFKRDPAQVKDQLARLDQLVRSALVEMQTLISTLRPDASAAPGLVPALHQQLSQSRIAGNLDVSLEVDGEQTLKIAEQQALLGIAQEALNNIIKHAGTHQATIRLHLKPPCWMEIEDHGQGFDRQAARQGGRLGLTSMQERAAEIGWEFQVITSPGTGTRIRVEAH